MLEVRTCPIGRAGPFCAHERMSSCNLVGLAPNIESILHKRMWEANFGSVDGAIASCFDESQKLCVLRIEYDAVDAFLHTHQCWKTNEASSTRTVKASMIATCTMRSVPKGMKVGL